MQSSSRSGAECCKSERVTETFKNCRIGAEDTGLLREYGITTVKGSARRTQRFLLGARSGFEEIGRISNREVLVFIDGAKWRLLVRPESR